jgi:DNA invertase Pin-like site-specific DNA recombinase
MSVIYCRVSTKYQKEDGKSLESQRVRCQDYARKNQMFVHGIFEDVKSGKTMDREGLMRALESLSQGNTLLVASLSRLSRNPKDVNEIMDIIKSKECQLKSISEDTSTMASVNRLVQFAEQESAMTSERVKAGMAYKRKLGEAVGRPPFGFMYRGKKLLKHTGEQEIIETIKQLRDDDYSLNNIIDILKESKMKPRSGKWHPSMISRIADRGDK